MIDGTQVIDDSTLLVAEFMPITIWSVGEENVVNYVLPPGFEEKEADWIGIFKVNFFYYILNEYKSYICFNYRNILPV